MNRLKRKWIWILLILLLVVSFFIARSSFSLNYASPRPGTGAVIGRLDLSSQDGNQRYTAQDLYLARSVEANMPGIPPAIAFSYSTDPHTVAYDSTGRFVFSDVPPGNYVLIVWHPGLSFVIESPEGGAFRIDVEANKTIDLGTIAPQQ
ncbi:MAG: hypothetical protein KGJ80_19415 [Chloroflexota bacterium]|nr:hypothetical protein [Chloroflexota bacterium]